MATALVKGYEGEFDPTQFKDLYQERVRKIIDAEVSNRISTHPSPAIPTSGAPDLMEEIRLSLAEIESKKLDANSSKKPLRKTPTVAKKKPQRVRASVSDCAQGRNNSQSDFPSSEGGQQHQSRKRSKLRSAGSPVLL